MNPTKKVDYVSMTYPHNRPGPPRPDLRTSDIKMGFHIKEFNKACPPIPSLNDIDWTSIRAIGKSEYGTSGVILIETDKGACVIKGSQEIAVEYFSNLLFKALKVTTPEMKVVKWNDEEFKLIQENLDRCSFDQQSINLILRGRLNCPFLFIMEYIPNITISEMGEKRSKHIFDPNYPSSRDRLIRIGLIIATDTFINNCDRYPLIWRGFNGEENEGNPDNLLIRVETDFISSPIEMKDPSNLNFGFADPFAIDNRPNLLRKDDKLTVINLIKYHKEFEKMLKNLFEELKEVKEAKIDPLIGLDLRFRCIEKVSNFIFRNTNYRLKAMAEFQIMIGMVIQYINIVEMGSRRIQSIYRSIYSLNEDDWKDIWKTSFENINLEFLDDSIGLIRKYLISYDDIVLWVRSITLQQYIIKWNEEDEKETYILKNQKETFDKNIDNFLKIEGNLEEWELKDKEDPEQDERDRKEYELERKKAIAKLKNQQKEKNLWLEDKMKEYFSIDEVSLKENKKNEDEEDEEEEEEEKVLAKEKDIKMKELEEEEQLKSAILTQKTLTEEKEEKERKEREEKARIEVETAANKKNKGWKSFFTRKPTKK